MKLSTIFASAVLSSLVIISQEPGGASAQEQDFEPPKSGRMVVTSIDCPTGDRGQSGDLVVLYESPVDGSKARLRTTYENGSAQAILTETAHQNKDFEVTNRIKRDELGDHSKFADLWAKVLSKTDPIRESVCTKSDAIKARFFEKLRNNKILVAKFDHQ